MHTEEDEKQSDEYELRPKNLLPSNGGYKPERKPTPPLHQVLSAKKPNSVNPMSIAEQNYSSSPLSLEKQSAQKMSNNVLWKPTHHTKQYPSADKYAKMLRKQIDFIGAMKERHGHRTRVTLQNLSKNHLNK